MLFLSDALRRLRPGVLALFQQALATHICKHGLRFTFAGFELFPPSKRNLVIARYKCCNHKDMQRVVEAVKQVLNQPPSVWWAKGIHRTCVSCQEDRVDRVGCGLVEQPTATPNLFAGRRGRRRPYASNTQQRMAARPTCHSGENPVQPQRHWTGTAASEGRVGYDLVAVRLHPVNNDNIYILFCVMWTPRWPLAVGACALHPNAEPSRVSNRGVPLHFNPLSPLIVSNLDPKPT